MKLYSTLLLVLSVIGTGCGEQGSQATAPTPVITPAPLPIPPPPLTKLECDDSLWPTYSQDRLRVLSACEHETGVVMRVDHEFDGDVTIDIKPKTGRLVQAGNALLNTPGCGDPWCLHVEIICQTEPNIKAQPGAEGACDNFKGDRHVVLPHLGDTIEVAGHWVTDEWHKWNEIHGAVFKQVEDR